MARDRSRGRLGPSLTTTWGLLAWLLVPLAVLPAWGPVKEVDLYWHILMGGDILANGRFGGDPSWTYGPADPSWITSQPAAEVLLYLLHRGMSWSGIIGFRIALSVGLMLSILLAITRVVRTRNVLPVDRSVAVTGLIVGTTMVAYVQERPQTISLVILPWIGVMVLRVMYTDRWPRWWVIGLIVMVWSWFHGAGVLVGPVLVVVAVIHALGVGGLKWFPILLRSIRRGWAVVLAALVAPMISPLGLEYYPQVRKIEQAASPFIQEWLAPQANNGNVWLAFLLVGLWALSLVRLAARSGRVWRTFRMDMLYVAGVILVMTSAGRYLAVGMLLLAPLVGRRLAQAWIRPSVRVERIRPRTALVVLAAVSVLMAAVAARLLINPRPVSAQMPLRVWDAMAQIPEERRVIVDYALGGQAELLGGVRVALDGRTDRYGGTVLTPYLDAIKGLPGWSGTLDRYPGTTDAVLAGNSGLSDRLRARGWKQACADGVYVWLTAPGVSGSCD